MAAEHDLHLDAIVLIKAGSIPKTSSGKIQRHACRNGYLDGTPGRGRPLAGGRGAATEPGSRPASEPPVADTPGWPAGRRPPPRTAPGPCGKKGKLTELVLEEIRRVAKERAAGMTLDSPIIETGLDSLERMEILASLEERFGGRFPPEILPQLETARDVIDAVEKYLGSEPRPRPAPAAGGNPRRRTTASSSFPNTSNSASGWTCWPRPAWAIRSSASTRASPTTAPSSAAAS